MVKIRTRTGTAIAQAKQPESAPESALREPSQGQQLEETSFPLPATTSPNDIEDRNTQNKADFERFRQKLIVRLWQAGEEFEIAERNVHDTLAKYGLDATTYQRWKTSGRLRQEVHDELCVQMVNKNNVFEVRARLHADTRELGWRAYWLGC